MIIAELVIILPRESEGEMSLGALKILDLCFRLCGYLGGKVQRWESSVQRVSGLTLKS